MESSFSVFKQLLTYILIQQGLTSIYKACDTIEGFKESLGMFQYEDHNFKDDEIIYLMTPSDPNNICLNDYYMSWNKFLNSLRAE